MTIDIETEETEGSSPYASFKLHNKPRLLAKEELPELFKQAQWYISLGSILRKGPPTELQF